MRLRETGKKDINEKKEEAILTNCVHLPGYDFSEKEVDILMLENGISMQPVSFLWC